MSLDRRFRRSRHVAGHHFPERDLEPVEVAMPGPPPQTRLVDWGSRDGGEDVESVWVGQIGRGGRGLLWTGLIAVAVLALAGVGGWQLVRRSGVEAAPVERRPDGIEAAITAAQRVAGQFLACGDPQARLAFVRDPQAVAGRMQAYAPDALAGAGVIRRMLGHSAAERPATAFKVELAEGGWRMLEVVGTADGPKVDWDAYARYCSAGWEDLLAGVAPTAEVRVFVEPGDYFREPFGNEAEWTCFRLSTPDVPHAMWAYAPVGSPRETRLKAMVLAAPRFRQHMTLQVARRAGTGAEALFEIERVVAAGWSRGERDLEQMWLDQAAKAAIKVLPNRPPVPVGG